MDVFAGGHHPTPPKTTSVRLPARMRRLSSKRSPRDAPEETTEEPAAVASAPRHLPAPPLPEPEREAEVDRAADGDGLTPEQAYRAAYRFVERYHARSQDPDTARLLQWMALQANGLPSHPEMWPDWLRSVDEALDER